jgi:hypothetical protein
MAPGLGPAASASRSTAWRSVLALKDRVREAISAGSPASQTLRRRARRTSQRRSQRAPPTP